MNLPKLPWKKPVFSREVAAPVDLSMDSVMYGYGSIADDYPGLPYQGQAGVDTLLDIIDSGGPDAKMKIPFRIYNSTDASMCLAAVYRCTTLISGNVQQCPPRVYREEMTEQGIRRTPAMPEIERMLNRQPHPMFSGPSLFEWMTAMSLLYGDGFTMIVRNGIGEITGLKPFHPTRVTRFRYETDRILYRMYDFPNTYGQNPGDQQEYIRDMSEVVDWQGALHNGFSAPSVIQRAAASAIALHQLVEKSEFEYLNSGNLQKIMMRRKEGAPKMEPEQIKHFNRRYTETYGGGIDTRSIPFVVDGSWEAPFQLSINPADAQLLATRKIAVKDILRAFGAPNVLAGDEEGVSAWGSGVAEISKNFLKHTVGPILNRYASELTRKIFPLDSPYIVEFDTSHLLRGSPVERAGVLRTALGGGTNPGWISINEARAYDGFGHLEGDEYNMVYTPGGNKSLGEQLDEALEKVDSNEKDALESEGESDAPEEMPAAETDEDENEAS